jgi:hypothetical protein
MCASWMCRFSFLYAKLRAAAFFWTKLAVVYLLAAVRSSVSNNLQSWIKIGKHDSVTFVLDKSMCRIELQPVISVPTNESETKQPGSSSRYKNGTCSVSKPDRRLDSWVHPSMRSDIRLGQDCRTSLRSPIIRLSATGIGSKISRTRNAYCVSYKYWMRCMWVCQ